MSITMTPGKLAGLKAVSDKRGVIAAAAMDQRGSLKKSLAKEKGVAEVPDAALIEFKELVTEVLTRHASAILLDPEFGLPAAKRRNGKGLLLAYEKTGYDAALPGRLPDLLDLWSVRRLKEAGADCIKILLYYTPYEKSPINDLKQAWVERIADECRAHDIPFFLELVGYSVHAGEDEKGLAYARRKPDIVTGSMEEFGKERYGVDVLKVEVPVQMDFVAGTKSFKGEQAYTRKEALDHFRLAATSTHKPFIYLSAGVSNPVFIETLELAGESGAPYNGVLCGRATWKDGIAVYARQGAKAFEDWLNTKGVENIENVNKALKSAHSWYDKVNVPALV
jgi:tagatose 1,6-diphosphate aldolase